jgi:hypothetical protein
VRTTADERIEDALAPEGTRWRAIAVLAAWTSVVVIGFAALFSYAAAPGDAPRAPTTWPAGSALVRDATRATLVMFVHPHCACSHASVVELSRTLRRVGDRASAIVVFVRPEDVPRGWEHTELRAFAAAIPGVTSVDDDGAIEAARFSALTSGTTLLYDAAGRLAFQGGLTSMRGHEGNSFGQERVVDLLTSGAADRDDSPVFGCALARAPERTSR